MPPKPRRPTGLRPITAGEPDQQHHHEHRGPVRQSDAPRRHQPLPARRPADLAAALVAEAHTAFAIFARRDSVVTRIRCNEKLNPLRRAERTPATDGAICQTKTGRYCSRHFRGRPHCHALRYKPGFIHHFPRCERTIGNNAVKTNNDSNIFAGLNRRLWVGMAGGSRQSGQLGSPVHVRQRRNGCLKSSDRLRAISSNTARAPAPTIPWRCATTCTFSPARTASPAGPLTASNSNAAS